MRTIRGPIYTLRPYERGIQEKLGKYNRFVRGFAAPENKMFWVKELGWPTSRPSFVAIRDTSGTRLNWEKERRSRFRCLHTRMKIEKIMSSNDEPITILLVEEDEGHRLLVERNLRRSNIVHPIVAVSDSQQAHDYIFGRNERGKPDHAVLMLVLLDLNLPVLEGYLVLKRVKSDKRTKLIPVIVLTSTEDPHEVKRCFELGCNVYLPKPVIYDKFSEVLQKPGQFLSIVCVPESSVA